MSRVHSGMALVLAAFFAGFVEQAVHVQGLRATYAATDPSRPAFFTESVEPIFQANCYRCHAGLNHRGGLNMGSRDLLIKGGHHGPAIVPGHPEQSLLLRLIRHEGPKEDSMNMPPEPRPKLSDADIATVQTWIRAGAAMPQPDEP